MKKRIYVMVIIVVFSLSVTMVMAQMLDSVRRVDSIEKKERDALLAISGNDDINIKIDLSCNVEYCIYSAYQKNLMDSKDNLIEKGDHTTNEILAIVQSKIKDRLKEYANATLERQSFVKVADGEIIYNEK